MINLLDAYMVSYLIIMPMMIRCMQLV